MKIDNLQLYDYLSLNNLVSSTKLQEFYQKAQKENIQLSDFLVAEKIFSQDKMLKMMANILGYKFVDLAQIKISKNILNLIPRKLANKFLAVVFEKNDKVIKVAICDLKNSEVESFLKRKNPLRVEFYLTDKNSIQDALSNYVQKIDLASERVKEETRDQRREKRQFTVKLINSIILNAISDLATEVQIEKKSEKVVVCYRIEGVLVEKMKLPNSVFTELLEIVKKLAKLDLQVKDCFQSGNFSVKKDGLETFFQVSVVPEVFSERIVMRLDDEASDNLSLEKLGLDKKNAEKIHRTLTKNKNLILITSPNGDGKTTTFYTLLQLINFSDRSIATIENPIEKIVNKVNQSRVDAQNSLTFKTGLISILNQDPDIIGVGEILDEGTLELALSIAEQKLILSTMYGNFVLETIENIYNLGVLPNLVADNLGLIIAQKLIRKLCVHCREKYFLTEAEISVLRKKYDLFKLKNIISKRNDFNDVIDFSKIPFYRSYGCEKCNKTGYLGKVGIFEVLELSGEIKRLIAKRESLQEIKKLLVGEGFETIKDDAFYKVVQGITDFKELERLDS